MKKNILFPFILCYFISYAQNISLTPIASGFENIIDIQNAGDERLFILELEGVIKILNLNNNTINETPFLDISNAVVGAGESGLLGIAFHPDFSTNGYFFVNYSNSSTNMMRISRFSVNENNPDIADPNSEFQIIDHDYFGIHNGGAIAFGPDGFLYITSGDRGISEGAQDTSVLRGKILRIDVDNPSNNLNYGIPEDNPFAGSMTEREEIWAYGLRNPFKFSFDTQENDIWIADVGENYIEEINKRPITESNINYGWSCYEGTEVNPANMGDCPAISDIAFPIYEYTHDVGISVIGGYVYRGTTYSDIQGYYFFADISGIIGSIDPLGNGSILPVSNPEPDNQWTTFGQDNQGEIYIGHSSFSQGQGTPSTIYKIEGEVLSIDQKEVPELTIFPNPTSTNIKIQVRNNIIQQIAIMDVKGSIAYSESNMNVIEKEINTSSFKNGLYIVTIKTMNGGTTSKKLIIQ